MPIVNKPWPGEGPKPEQLDQEWLDSASPAEIAQAVNDGKLDDVLAKPKYDSQN